MANEVTVTVPVDAEVFTCKTCVHFRNTKKWSQWDEENKGQWYRCEKLTEYSKTVDVVTGEIETNIKEVLCHDARRKAGHWSDEGKCGPDGKLWVPKEKNDLFKLLAREVK